MQQVNDHPCASGAPDETGIYAPQAAAAPGGESWVYGIPGQFQSGNTDGSMSSSTDSNMPASPIQGMNGEETPGGISSAAAQSQRMKNPVSMADTHMPPDSETAYQASLRSLLDRNVGYFVVATFLTGANQAVTWQGILHSVGSDYVVIYQPDYERYVSGDLYSLKFVQFHNVKGIPYCAASSSWQGTSM